MKHLAICLALILAVAGCDRKTAADFADDETAALATTLATPRPSRTDPPPIPEDVSDFDYDACMKTGRGGTGVTPYMHDCAVAEMTRLQAVMDREYAETEKDLADDEALEPFTESQRDWLTFRASNCRAFASTGGSIDVLWGIPAASA